MDVICPGVGLRIAANKGREENFEGGCQTRVLVNGSVATVSSHVESKGRSHLYRRFVMIRGSQPQGGPLSPHTMTKLVWLARGLAVKTPPAVL